MLFVVEMCRRDIYYEAKGTFVWPSTAHEQTALIECPRTKGKYASRQCLLGHQGKAKWAESDTSQCGMVSPPHIILLHLHVDL